MKYYRSIYVDIESLFDIRQGVLSKIMVEFAVDVTLNEAYYTREDNSFYSPTYGHIPHDKFQQIYNSYKEESLTVSYKTKMLDFVRHLTAKTLKQNALSGVEMVLGIEINLFGFSFSEKEASDLVEIVRQELGGEFEVTTININPKLIRMQQAKDRYIGMIFYDYATWVNSNESDFKELKTFTQTVLYVPRLYFNGKPTKEELAAFAKQNVDPFDLWEKAYGPLLGINYIPIAFYCIATPANAEELTTPIA
jgi:hypothetical protein